MVDAARLARRALIACALLALLGAAFWLDPLGLRGDAGLQRALTERGRVAVAGSRALREVRAQGATLVDAQSVPAVWRALAGSDASVLEQALEAAHVDALLVQPEVASKAQTSLRSRLAHYAHLPGMRG